MYPLYDNILVKQVESSGVLNAHSSMYCVVEVLALPVGSLYPEGLPLSMPECLRVGSKLLVLAANEFCVEDERFLFTTFKDIVCVL